MERVIAIVGPTAVGKTKASIDLAKRLGTEIISGDSMLIYRGLDVGTAKPSMTERAGVLHHLIDIRNPDEEFSVVEFKRLASDKITEINAAGNIPVIAGGTGLYIKALLEDYDLRSPPGDENLRRQLEQLAVEKGREFLHHLLAVRDPGKAAVLHHNDLRRVVRALEVCLLSDNCDSEKADSKAVYDSFVIGLTMDRTHLYKRINQRVDTMIANGLTAEVDELLRMGISSNCQSMQAIGYKEMVGFVQGGSSLEQVSEAIKQATRRFAKRQMTWFRKMPYITWVNTDEFFDHDSLMEHIYNLVAEKFGIE